MPDAMGFQTLDEMSREQIREGKLKKTPVFEGSPLPEKEQKRLLDMPPDERIDDRWLRDHPASGTVTTGAEVWAANGGSSPHQDPAERASGGIYQHVVDENGDVEPGVLREVATGRILSMEVVKARQTLDLAERGH